MAEELGLSGGKAGGGGRIGVAGCLEGMVLTGRIERGAAERILKSVRKAEAENATRMNASAAELAAAKQVADRLEEAAKLRKRQVALQLLTQNRILEQAGSHPQGFAAGVLAHLTKDPYGRATWSNVEYRHKAIFAQLNAQAGAFMERYMPTRLGWKQDIPGQRAVVRELYGEDTGDGAAKAAARACGETSDYARTRFNAAGGDIKTRSDWHIPQTHDRWRVEKAGQAEWVRFVSGLKIEIRDPESGDLLTGDAARAALTAMWSTIGSGGMKKMRPGAGFGAKLGNTRADPRLLQFKDADSWLAYNDRFGAGNIYRLVAGHLDGMARDIALLEVLGPNPDATVRFLADAAKMPETHGNANAVRIAQMETRIAQANERIKEKATSLVPLDQSDPDVAVRTSLTGKVAALRRDVQPPRHDKTPLQLLDNATAIKKIYDEVAQKVESADNWMQDMAIRFIQDTRGMLSMAQLGSAPLSSVTDLKTLQATMTWNGLDGTKAVEHFLALLNPANEADRAMARRFGVIAEEAVRLASSAQRFQDDVGEGIVARLTDSFHRLTGLTPWTRALRACFGLEFMGNLADHVGQALADLPPLIRRAIEGKGVTPAMWDAARAVPLTEYRGAKFLVPSDLARSDDALVAEAGQRLHELILQETDYAIPEPDARVRTMLTFGTRRGTLAGEVLRTATMYKSFPASVVMMHGFRAATAHGTGGWRTTKAGYAVDLVIGLTVMGALGVQMRQVALGKDPRDMTAGSFWVEAFFQGGGLGIFGDFIRAGVSRKDQDVTATLTGPGVGLVSDLARLTSQNIRQAADGVPTHFGGEAVRFTQRYTPGMNIWYARLAFDRLWWARLHQLAEPNYPAVMARTEARALKDYNQKFYWRPGDTGLPDRGPTLGAAIGVDP